MYPLKIKNFSHTPSTNFPEDIAPIRISTQNSTRRKQYHWASK